jgi:hypothetical protein
VVPAWRTSPPHSAVRLARSRQRAVARGHAARSTLFSRFGRLRLCLSLPWPRPGNAGTRSSWLSVFVLRQQNKPHEPFQGGTVPWYTPVPPAPTALTQRHRATTANRRQVGTVRPCAVSPSWPAQAGHPRLAVLISAKGVDGGPSPTMTIKANAPSDECPNLPAVRCKSSAHIQASRHGHSRPIGLAVPQESRASPLPLPITGLSVMAGRGPGHRPPAVEAPMAATSPAMTMGRRPGSVGLLTLSSDLLAGNCS